MAKRRFNRERAARILAEATVSTDGRAARAHDVSTATVRRWRKRLETDPELAGLYARELERVDGLWRDELRQVLLACARKVRDLVEQAETIQDLHDVLDAMRTSGELVVQYEALVTDGLPATPREGREAQAQAPGAGEGAPSVH